MDNNIITPITLRKKILEMIYKARVSHIGAAFSVVDILYVLYFKVANINKENIKSISRDKIILSKGHASAALYTTLCYKNLLPMEYLDSYCVNGGKLPCHIDKDVAPCLDASTGSLGHGLGIACGLALASKNDKLNNHIFVILGDGECNEGSVWEAIMFAVSKNLSNLTIIVDKNNLQAMGYNNDIIKQDNLLKQFESFGCFAISVNGHNLEEIENALNIKKDKPVVIIANTIKGKGVSFMENRLEWHYKSPSKEQYEQAMEELEKQENSHA